MSSRSIVMSRVLCKVGPRGGAGFKVGPRGGAGF